MSENERKSKLPEHIHIKVTDSKGPLVFIVNRKSQLVKLMQAYTNRRGYTIGQVTFKFGGLKVMPHNTPNDLAMQDNEKIDVSFNQKAPLIFSDGGFATNTSPCPTPVDHTKSTKKAPSIFSNDGFAANTTPGPTPVDHSKSTKRAPLIFSDSGFAKNATPTTNTVDHTKSTKRTPFIIPDGGSNKNVSPSLSQVDLTQSTKKTPLIFSDGGFSANNSPCASQADNTKSAKRTPLIFSDRVCTNNTSPSHNQVDLTKSPKKALLIFSDGGSTKNAPHCLSQLDQTTLPNQPTCRNFETPTGSNKSGNEKNGPPGWTSAEEEQLVMSWLNVCEQPISSIIEIGEIFYNKLHIDFNQRSKIHYRDIEQIKTHWAALNIATFKFNELFASIERNPPSGSSPSDWLLSAHALYHQQNKEPFQSLPAWQKLRYALKWRTDVKKDQPKLLELPSNTTDQTRDSNKSSADAQQTNTNIDGQQTSTNIDGQRTSTIVGEQQTTTSVSGQQTPTSVVEQQTTTSVGDKQAPTGVVDQQTTTSAGDRQTTTSIGYQQTATRIGGHQAQISAGAQQASDTCPPIGPKSAKRKRLISDLGHEEEEEGEGEKSKTAEAGVIAKELISAILEENSIEKIKIDISWENLKLEKKKVKIEEDRLELERKHREIQREHYLNEVRMNELKLLQCTGENLDEDGRHVLKIMKREVKEKWLSQFKDSISMEKEKKDVEEELASKHRGIQSDHQLSEMLMNELKLLKTPDEDLDEESKQVLNMMKKEIRQKWLSRATM